MPGLLLHSSVASLTTLETLSPPSRPLPSTSATPLQAGTPWASYAPHAMRRSCSLASSPVCSSYITAAPSVGPRARGARLPTASAAPSAAAAKDAKDPDQRSEDRKLKSQARAGGRQRKAQQAPQQRRTAFAAREDAFLLVGFHPEELEIVQQRLPELLPPSLDGDVSDSGAAVLVDVTTGMLPYTVSEVMTALQQHLASGGSTEVPYAMHAVDSTAATSVDTELGTAAGAGAATAASVAIASGRLVLLVGPAAQGLGAALNDHLADWGVVPALIAAYQPRHQGLPLRDVVQFLRDAHAAYYGLLSPVWVEPLQQRQQTVERGGGRAGEEREERPAVVSSNGVVGAAATDPDSAATAEEAEEGEGGDHSSAAGPDHLAVLEEVRVVLSAAMDAGEVPSIHGHYRQDAGHVVVLDGLLTDPERRDLLGWLTAPEHNHGGPPPENKWEQACVDRVGDQATWGLQPQVLEALRDDPPPPVVALQTRLAALYPEYDICHMPADQISEAAATSQEGEEVEETPLSSFVGNAVMPGDPCAWHVDADPTSVPPYSPWVHNFGYYHNREPCRPLFVSALLYLNDTWPEDNHAETLFLDPETQLGLFVRPAPGRVVLLEQDVPHRISAPSRTAAGPRYSLVWKLVLVPKQESDPGADGSSGQTAPGVGVNEAYRLPQGYQSICRPEWGEPLRIGSANGRSCVRAFQRRRG